jgi:sulfatase modifying factor 1
MNVRSFVARVAVSAAVASLGAVFAIDLRAATPDEAPPESRAQVADALRALAPVLSVAGRSLAANAPGTIESAIQAYAPGTFHRVQEGALGAPIANARCPPEMGLVAGRVCVDRYEASLVEKRADGSFPLNPPNRTPVTGHAYVARSAAGVRPQAYVSGAQAAAACREAGKRLCEPVEWRAACGGTQAYAYPYGPERKPGVCHDSGVAPMLVYHADTLKTGWGNVELNDPRNIELEGTLAPTGAYPACVNDYGLYDMVGNLDEWTADPNGTFQGGFWLDTSLHGDGCAYRTIAHPYDYRDYSIGFRCCADPTP